MASPFGLGLVLTILGAHAMIGLGGAIIRPIATAHAIVTVAIVVPIMLFSKRQAWVVAAAAYGGMCDVFWRMTKSHAPWEISKYLLALGAIVLLIRFVHRWRRGAVPIALLLVLVPGVLHSGLAQGIGFARDNASGYEMGLVSFALAALAFRHLIATRTEAWNLCWIVISPLVAVLAVTSHALITNPNLDFTSESSFTATGGYGPNQVSSALGLIALICVLLAFLPWARRFWPVLGALVLWSLWGTFLTFSRGGIYSLVLAGAAMLLVGITSRGARIKSILTLAAATTALLVVFASANNFAGNWLDTRYQDRQTAGRSSIIEKDIAVWAQNPIIGVGTGRADLFRGGGAYDEAASHTEFSRLVAEHGMFGFVAIILLVTALVQAYRWGLSYWNRLMIVAFSVWALTTMLHAATRIGAVSVMLALTQLRVTDDLSPEPDYVSPSSAPTNPSEPLVVTTAGSIPPQQDPARVAGRPSS